MKKRKYTVSKKFVIYAKKRFSTDNDDNKKYFKKKKPLSLSLCCS